MPLGNDANKEWNGYLVEGLAGSGPAFLRYLQERLAAHNLPKVRSNPATVNMWWRKDSPCLDIYSEIDGMVMVTVHAMDYGTGLFVGVAYVAVSSLGNYYKRMAATAFLTALDNCLTEAVELTAEGASQEKPVLQAIGKVGKYGG